VEARRKAEQSSSFWSGFCSNMGNTGSREIWGERRGAQARVEPQTLPPRGVATVWFKKFFKRYDLCKGMRQSLQKSPCGRGGREMDAGAREAGRTREYQGAAASTQENRACVTISAGQRGAVPRGHGSLR